MFFLFIFESIGTQELILIGIIALIFLGPRRMPDIARKLGKMMSEFRNTTNEFKATWEREVNFEEEANAIRTGELDSEPKPISRMNPTISENVESATPAPEVKEIDAAVFDENAAGGPGQDVVSESHTGPQDNESELKQNWL
jgi:Tat protein translocase TatB subunit